MNTIRLKFLRLNVLLKEFGRTKCKFHKNRKANKNHVSECHHPTMSYGGMGRNTDCEITNCPRILYGDEGGKHGNSN